MDANINIGLDVNASGAERSVGSLKAQLRAAQAEVAAMSAEFGATSVEAANAARKAAELADAIGDAKRLTDAFNPDAKFTALTRAIGGVLNGFQAFQGAIGLMGVESEDLQRQLLKVQSAMALTQGLQGLFEAKDDFIALGSVVKNVVVKAFTTLRGAIATTGIGALVIAVGYLVNEYIAMSEAEKKAAEEQKKLNEELKKQKEFVSSESVGFIKMIGMLKATNAGSKERKELIKDINTQYGTTLKNLQDEAAFQRQLNLEVDNYIKYKLAEYALKQSDEKIQKIIEKRADLQKNVNEAQENYNDILAQFQRKQAGVTVMQVDYARNVLVEQKKKLDDNSNALKFLGKSALEAASDIEALTLGGTKFVEGQDKAKDATDETTKSVSLLNDIEQEKIKRMDEGLAKELAALEQSKKERIQDVKDTEANADEKATLLEEIEKTYQENIKDIKQRYTIDGIQYATKEEVDAVKEKNKTLEEEEKKKQEKLEQEAKDYRETIKRIQKEITENGLTEQEKEVKAVEDKYAELVIKAQGNAEDLKAIEERKQQELDGIKTKYADKDENREKEKWAKIFGMTSEGFSILSDAVSLFSTKSEKAARKQFQVQKAFNLAAAITNTAMAITSALALSPKDSVFPGQRFVEAGLAAAAGAVNIAKISQTQFQGGGPPPDTNVGGGGSGERFVPPSLNPTGVQNMGTTTVGGQPGFSGIGKVVVVESDITNVQNKVSVIQSRSFLGG